jgi:hypothetical protein
MREIRDIRISTYARANDLNLFYFFKLVYEALGTRDVNSRNRQKCLLYTGEEVQTVQTVPQISVKGGTAGYAGEDV